MRDDGIVRQPPSTASSPNPNASSGCLGIQRRRPRFVSPHGDASGQASKVLLQAAAREFWLIAANHDLDLQVLHIPGEQLTASADALSRYHLAPAYRTIADAFIKDHRLTAVPLPSDLLQPPLDW